MASSEKNQISDGSNQPPLNQCKMWIESFASVVRKELLSLLGFVWKKLIPSLVWVGAVLITIWIYGYIVCNFSGIAEEAVKILLTSLITLGFISILILIVWKSDPERRPSRFIVLGIVVTAIAMLVQSFSGELICSHCLLWGDPDAAVSCRVRVMEFWFGNKGFIWGIATALFGAAWNFWEQYKRDQEEQQRFLERIRQFSLSSDQDPAQIQLVREWEQLRRKLCDERIRSEITQGLVDELNRIRERNSEKWTHVILSWIDWRLFRKVNLEDDKAQVREDDETQEREDDETQTFKKEFQELLDLLISIDKPVSKDARCNQTQTDGTRDKNNIHWSTIKEFIKECESGTERCKSQPKKSGDLSTEEIAKLLQAIFGIWEKYDVLVRELIAFLIKKWIITYSNREGDPNPEKIRNLIKKNIYGLRHKRRFIRHKQIQLLFPKLYAELYPPLPGSSKYVFLPPWPQNFPDPLSENVQHWLEERRNPFGMARAEWEKLTTDDVHFPGNWRLIKRMTEDTMIWIAAPAGSGRTTLARIAYSQLQKTVFPIYMMLDIPEEASISRYFLEQLLHHLVEMWGGIIMQQIDQNMQQQYPFNGPTAFLDLNYQEQRKVAQLFFWEMGSLEAIWAWLTALGVDLTGTIEGKALKARVEFFLEAPPPQTLPESWMIDLASARPVDLSSTLVLLELNNAISQDQALRVITLAARLQQEKVYLKIIASLQPPAVCPLEQLSWTQQDLRKMLDNRDRGGIMDNGAKETLSKFIHTHANSSPREMMRLGNIALTLRAERDAEKDDEKPDKEADLLPMVPTEEKVLTEEDIKEAIQVYKIFRFHKP